MGVFYTHSFECNFQRYVKMAYKILLQFVSGCLCSFGLYRCLDAIWGWLSYFEALWKYKPISFILNYDHFLFFIDFVGLPVGSLIGIWVVDRIIFKVSLNNFSGMAIGFLLSVLGVVLVLWILPLIKVDIVTFVPGFSSMGYDVYVYFAPIMIAFLSTVGYNSVSLFRLFTR